MLKKKKKKCGTPTARMGAVLISSLMEGVRESYPLMLEPMIFEKRLPLEFLQSFKSPGCPLE